MLDRRELLLPVGASIGSLVIVLNASASGTKPRSGAISGNYASLEQLMVWDHGW